MMLLGRRVAVTGANRGLGLAIAEACAREGAHVLMGARDLSALATAQAQVRTAAAGGARVEARGLNVADPNSADAFAAAARELFGGCDVLVNNAGIYGPKGAIVDIAWPEWEEALRINLFGVIHCCRAFVPLLRQAAGRGKIVNLSGGGATQPMPFLSAYAASKAAVVRFTETLALEEPGLDVNAVAPGALNTRLLDELLEAGPDKVGKDFYAKSLKQKAQGGTPLNVGADMIAWMASAQSDGVTGRLLSSVWDNWKGLPERLDELNASDVYTLRRIVPKDRGKDWGEPK